MNLRQWTTRLCLLAMLLTSSVSAAAEIPSYDMQEIIIVGDAAKTPVTEDSINVRHINPAKTATLPEILSQTAGIDIQLRSTVGDNQDGTVKLRGFDARRFTVLLNGRPVNSAGVMGGQYIDWNTIPLDTVERIQIVKGGKSAAYGNTLGGVINIVTKEKPSGGEATVILGDQGVRVIISGRWSQTAPSPMISMPIIRPLTLTCATMISNKIRLAVVSAGVMIRINFRLV